MKIVLKGKHAQTGMTRFGVMVVNLRQVIIAPEGDPMTNQILNAVDFNVDIERPDGRYNVVAVADVSMGKLLEIKSGKVNAVKDLDAVAVDSILTMADVPAEPAAAVPADAFAGVAPMEEMPMDFNMGDGGSPPPPPATVPAAGEAPWPDENENWNSSSGEVAAGSEEAPVVPAPDASKTLTEIPPGEMPEELKGAPKEAPDVQVLKARITELEGDNARLSTDNKKLRDASLGDGNTELSETKVQLLKTLNEATDGMAKMEDENSSLAATLDRAQREITRLRFDLRTANGKLQDETKRANAAEAEVTRLKERNAELEKPTPAVQGEPAMPTKPDAVPAAPAKSDVQVHRHEHALTPEVTALLSSLTKHLSHKRSGFGSVVMVLLAIALSLFGLLKVAEWVPGLQPAVHDVNVVLGFPQSTETMAPSAPSTIDEKRLVDAERLLADNSKKLADANRELKALSESQRVITAERDKLQKLIATVNHVKVIGGQIVFPSSVAPQGTTNWSGAIGGKNLNTVPIATALQVGDFRGFMVLYFFKPQNQYAGYAIVLTEE